MAGSISLRIIGTIDKLNARTGHLVAVLLVPLILANAVEVFMRYVFNRPTLWAADVTVMSSGALFMLGAAYTLLRGAHVRTDVLWEKFSERKKGVIDAVSYLLFFLPAMAVLFAISLDEFFYAWSIDERSNLSPWQPIVWPLRGVVPATAALLFLQGVSELLKALWAARTGVAFARHHPER
jgi:TRAP-type mannitol/chloroaromatic compound transport system permease small subunit